MTIKLNDKLVDYMNTEGFKDIVLDVITCRTWAGTLKEISTRFVEKNNSFSDDSYISHTSDLGNIYYKPNSIRFQDNAEIRLVPLLWAKRIALKGIRTA